MIGPRDRLRPRSNFSHARGPRLGPMTTDDKPRVTTASPHAPNVSAEGVDLTQIRALKAMTPTERLRALVVAANNLLRLKENARRL